MTENGFTACVKIKFSSNILLLGSTFEILQTIYVFLSFSRITLHVHINLHLTFKLVIKIFSSLYLFCQLNGANIFAYSVVVFEIAAYKLYFQYVPEVIGEIYVWSLIEAHKVLQKDWTLSKKLAENNKRSRKTRLI